MNPSKISICLCGEEKFLGLQVWLEQVVLSYSEHSLGLIESDQGM